MLASPMRASASGRLGRQLVQQARITLCGPLARLMRRGPVIEQRAMQLTVRSYSRWARNRPEHPAARHGEGVEFRWILGTGELARDADDRNSSTMLPPTVHCSPATGMARTS
jgi:hypothetical protein